MNRVQQHTRFKTESPVSERADPRCFRCFRPTSVCHCDLVPTIDNQTEVLILQHRQERRHPFNTARMVDQALTNSRLICRRNEDLAAQQLPFGSKAGLLYPGKNSQRLDQIDPSQRPQQLVVLDGTWHHARTMFRDIPQLHALPCYRLAPATPGQFRIRLEPNDTALSTVEAVVAALRTLEPMTEGLDCLLGVFNLMNDRQLAHPQASYDQNFVPVQQRGSNFPRSLRGDLSNVVVVYGEAMPGRQNSKSKRKATLPVCWVAQRMGPTGPFGPNSQTFSEILAPDSAVSPAILDHFGLSPTDFDGAITRAEFCTAWKRFLKPGDRLVAWQRGTIQLLENVGVQVPSFEILKSTNVDPANKHSTLDELLDALRLVPTDLPFRGRAGQRLANAVTLLMHLNRESR